MKTHDLDVPRIGYVHSWSNTQNEGWVRAALDNFGVPYTYFGDIKLREGNLRAKYDVIVFPHVGGTAQSMVNGLPKIGPDPTPYKKSELTPNLGVLDQADDIRGGMGFEGLMNLYQFVKDGGLLIVEGATSTIFPEYKLVNGVTVESPAGPVHARVDRARPGRRREEPDHVRLRRGADPGLLQPGPRAGGRHGRWRRARRGRRRADSRCRDERGAERGFDAEAVAVGAGGAERLAAPSAAGRRSDAAAARLAAQGRAGAAVSAAAWRRAGPMRRASSCASPSNPDEMLLSGVLVGGQALANRAQVVDAPLGSGPRRDVRHPALLALADPGHLLPGVQCDHELERLGGGEVGRGQKPEARRQKLDRCSLSSSSF